MIYYINVLIYYNYTNPCEPVYEIFNNLYFTTKEQAIKYIKKYNIKDYTIEELKKAE